MYGINYIQCTLKKCIIYKYIIGLYNLLYKAAVFFVCLSVPPPFFRHDRRTATTFGTHIRVDTGLILSQKNLSHLTPGVISRHL